MANPNFQILSDTELYSNSLTPLSADVLSSNEYSSNYYIWDFGDGNKGTGETVEHVYETVGDFDITLTQFLSSGEPVESDPQTVTVRNLIPNLMEWDSDSYNGGSITASVKNSKSFKTNVYNSWQQYDENSFLHLYVENSKSIPFDITDKRIHLKPNWRFLDNNDNVIDTLSLSQDKIYAQKINGEIYLDTTEVVGSVFVGVSSQSDFFFVDDTPSGIDPTKDYLPSTIIVTQNLSGIYGDDKFTKEDYLQYPSLIKWIFIDNIVPDKLSITSNGIFDISDIKFINTQIPYNIRLVDSSGNFIKTNPIESDAVSAYEIDIGFIGDVVKESLPSFDWNTLERFVPDFSNLGGFFESYFIPTQSTTESVTLTASTLIDYTVNELLTRYGIFSDENSNRIYRTSFIEGFDKSCFRKKSDVIGNEYDGFISNKFGAVIDTNYNAVFLDSDDSRIEIYDTAFELLSSIELSSYDQFILSSDGLSSYRGHPSPAQICLDEEGNYFITLHDTADLLYVIDNEIKKIDLYPQISGEFVTLSGDLIVYDDGIELSSYVYYDTEDGFVFQPSAVDILSDNETIYIAYVKQEYNFIQKYTLDKTTDPYSLSSIGTIELSSNVPVDMVSNRDGDVLYILTTNYFTRESYIKQYNTLTNTLSTEKFIGYDAEFLTIDIDQNPWTICKSKLSSGVYNSIVKMEGGKLSSYSTKLFDDTTYIVSLSATALSSKPDDDYSISVNNTYIIDPQRNLGNYDLSYIWTRDYNIYQDDVIKIEVFDGWQGAYVIHPWELKLEWTDGVIQTLSGGFEDAGVSQLSDPSIPTNGELGISPGVYFATGPYGEFYYETSGGTITVNRDDIPDTKKPMINVGGIGGDSYGNIWLLDSDNNRTIIFNKDDPTDYNIVNISEDQSILTNNYVAYGDWNGFRWYNKFGYGGNTITYELSGQSEPFNIYPQNKYRLQKINEDFDATETLKSYRTTDLMLNYDNLFDNFLGSIYGNSLDDGTYIGKNIYEKIANFVMNHGDIETCSIDALESFCEETGIEFDTKLDFPRDIKKIVDLFSIKFKKLWGEDYKTGLIEDYKGDELNTLTYEVSADPQTKFIAKEKFNNYYSIITPLMIDSLSSYPISSYEQSWGWGLSVPSGGSLEDYYEFYEFNTVEEDRLISIIDWDNPLTDTTIEPISSFSNYMGEDGIVSTILGDKLRTGLGLYL